MSARSLALLVATVTSVAVACGAATDDRGGKPLASKPPVLRPTVARAPGSPTTTSPTPSGTVASAGSPSAPSGAAERALASAPPTSTRRGGGLIVEWPPRQHLTGGGRGRTHVVGPLGAQSTRTWAGPTRVPDWMPLTRGPLELFLLDEVADGLFALYREPYGATPASCATSGPLESHNCEFIAALYLADGSERWSIRLNDLLSRRDHIEVQDARYADGVVYFNEACQSYSRQAGGRCSALVAVDPVARRVLWRSRPLVSNGEIAVIDARWILAAYGFTAEKDQLSLVSRANGRVVSRLELPAAAHQIALAPGMTDVAEIRIYGRGVPWRVRIDRLASARPRLVPETAAPPQLPSRFPTLRLGDRDATRSP